MIASAYKSLLLKLTLLLTCVTLAFSIYTNITLTEKTILLEKELSTIRLEQTSYSESQIKALEEQAKTVLGVQEELIQAKKTTDEAASKLTDLEETLAKEKTKAANTVISASDIANFLSSIPQVVCKQNNGNISSGSATIWKFSTIPYAILTNKHVVANSERCVLVVSNKDSVTQGVYELAREGTTFNIHTDTAAVAVQKAISTTAPSVTSLNYGVASMRKCPSNISLGSPVVIIGFPAYARRDTEVNLETMGKVKVIFRTVTNGIVSGYDSSEVLPKGNLEEHNFFISAKIDSGNSGGIALAKDAAGMCVLGLPTWLTVGNYETQGLVQNIRNVLP